MALLDFLLAVEPDDRGSSSSALQHEFFTTNPLPLDPSSLPKYPPSKEFDAKLRDEENRRRKVATTRGRGHESFRKSPKESRALPVEDANAELAGSLQKRQGQNNPKSSSMSDGKKAAAAAERRGAEPVIVEKVVIAHQHPPPDGEDDDSSLSFSSSSSSSVKRRSSSSSYMNGGHRLSKFSNSVAVGRLDSSSHLGSSGESSSRRGGQEWSHHLLLGPNNSSSYNDQDNSGANDDSTLVYSPVKKHLHCSGPLLRPGGNMDEMLKEHEKQIRNAVRIARLDKSKTNNGLTETESFLLNTQNVIR